ncbi:Dfp1/Him1, central region-domain-containing protein [Ephemerocybe angulata]|uniref:Dfp1/Him1, central region-domain-containing protein n=1 Tax=Ephemerocybe angulata TaxID=980116 RepID=A0A8H6I7I2_9AGAR|nr:Dfp1/Him1, central region-domain-containing protein [Tulosesus angulatus]
MASTMSGRRALSTRSLQTPSLSSQKASARPSSASFKRPRSPEPAEHNSASQTKKPRASASTSTGKRQERLERDQQKQEFKEKYTRAFPTFRFYFEQDHIALKPTQVNLLIARIEDLGGQIEDFFSKDITHVITDRPTPSTGDPSSKALQSLKSPIQLKSKGIDDTARNNDIVAKARAMEIKVWNALKLDSVINRCLECSSVTASVSHKSQPAPTQKLSQLLSKEKYYGPGDRDPSQKRHDYRYFTKGSFFVLVEDMRGEVATIAAHEYPAPKDKAKMPWPVLHCHPNARGPFIAYDDKEKQRWERAQQKKLEENQEEEQVVKPPRPSKTTLRGFRLKPAVNNKGFPDLRRSASLNNLKRQAQEEPEAFDQDFEAEGFDSANASGFLVSGAAYMAASGNSVGITSTTGTTSTAGGLRNMQLPAAMDLAMKRQIVTSKKATAASKEKRIGNMDPPPTLPSRHLLKKSKSMSFKQPKREEGSKPGYCECCRQKFEDFKHHVVSSRHRRFAQNDDNFMGLDAILSRVQRKSLVEVEEEEERRKVRCRMRCSGLTSSSPCELTYPSDSTP